MTEDHAVLPFTVVNTPEFELPKTGSYGTWMYTAGGLAAACAGAALLLKGRKRGKDSE
jgi:LPXTG-motif cell wall-anchored protein